MNPSFEELPTDVRRSILQYLSLPDVIRLGMTDNKMPDFTWPYFEEVLVSRDYPIEAHFWVLSRDLSYVRDISLYLTRSDEEFAKDSNRIPDLTEKIASLTKLTNLHALTTDISLPWQNGKKNQILTVIPQLIATLTQLQSLTWYSADLTDVNIGELLSAHTRLTLFSTHTKQRLYGVEKLTQVRNLDLSFCENLDDESLLTALELTQLTSLGTYYDDKITDKSFTRITNLTNMERLSMNHAPGIKSTSFELLSILPKLSELVLNYPWDNEQQEFSATLAIIGQLTNLTQLTINNYEGNLNFGTLTNLTGLKSIEVDCKVDTANFSSFSKLTKLAFRPKEEFKLTNLPPNLQHLDISSFELQEDGIEAICSLEQLKTLEFSYIDFDGLTLSRWITRLTKITDLALIPCPPIELFQALCELPNLANLTCSKIPPQVTMLTQLMELVYWTSYNKDLKDMAPF